jgi:hypothetical protein
MRIRGNIQGQFPNYQIHFVEQGFDSLSKVVELADHTKLPSLLQKLIPSPVAQSAEPEFCRRKIDECTLGPKLAKS